MFKPLALASANQPFHMAGVPRGGWTAPLMNSAGSSLILSDQASLQWVVDPCGQHE